MEPASLSLAEWLDAGYVLLTEDADPDGRELLEVLFASESEEDLKLGFDDLRALSEWREAEQKRIEAEMAKSGRAKPKFGRGRVKADDLEAAHDEWTRIALESQAAAEAGE